VDLLIDGRFDHHTGAVRRLQAARQPPADHPSLFHKRSFVAGLAIVGAFFAALSGFQLAFNLLLQLGLHWTAPHTSLTLIPWTLGSPVAVVLAGAVLTQKLSRATLQLGLGIAVIGLLGGPSSTAATASPPGHWPHHCC
jgi:hypothetical protein